MTLKWNKKRVSLFLYYAKFIAFPIYLFFMCKMFPYFSAYGFLGKTFFIFQIIYILVELISIFIKDEYVVMDSIQNFVTLLMYGYFILLFFRFKQFFGLYLSSSYLWYFRINILIGILGISLVIFNTYLSYRKVLS